MNRKRNFAKMALLGVLLCGLASPTFVGCKDYDDDIDKLQEQIDANKDAATTEISSAITKQIGELETKLNAAINNKADASVIAGIQSDITTLQALKSKVETLERNASNYLTKDAAEAFLTSEDLVDYLKIGALEDYLKKDALDGYLTSDDLAGYVKDGDLEGYLKEDALETLLGTYGFLTQEDLKGKEVNTIIRGLLADELAVIQSIIDEFNDAKEAAAKLPILIRDIKSLQADLDKLAEIGGIEGLLGKLANLEARIQSVSYVPTTLDKVVYAYRLAGVSSNQIVVRFKVYPGTAQLTKEMVSIDAQKLSRATEVFTIDNIKGVEGEEGLWEVTMNKGANVVEDGYAAALVVNYKEATISSDYFTINNKELAKTDLMEAIFTPAKLNQVIGQNVGTLSLGMEANAYTFPVSYGYTTTGDLFTVNDKGEVALTEEGKKPENVGKNQVIRVTATAEVPAQARSANNTVLLGEQEITVTVSSTAAVKEVSQFVFVEAEGTTSYYISMPTPIYAKNGSVKLTYKVIPADAELTVNNLGIDVSGAGLTNTDVKITNVERKLDKITVTFSVLKNIQNPCKVAIYAGNVYSDYNELTVEKIEKSELQITYTPSTSEISWNDHKTGVNLNTASLTHDVSHNYKPLTDLGFDVKITKELSGDDARYFAIVAGKIVAAEGTTVNEIGKTVDVKMTAKVGGVVVVTKNDNRFELSGATSTDKGTLSKSADAIILADMSNYDVVHGLTEAEITGKLENIGIDKIDKGSWSVKKNGVDANGYFDISDAKVPVISAKASIEAGTYVLTNTYTTEKTDGTKLSLKVEITVVVKTTELKDVVSFAPTLVNGIVTASKDVNGKLYIDASQVVMANSGYSMSWNVKSADAVKLEGSNVVLKDNKALTNYTLNYDVKNSSSVVVAKGSFVIKFVNPIAGTNLLERASGEDVTYMDGSEEKTVKFQRNTKLSNNGSSKSIDVLTLFDLKNTKNGSLIELSYAPSAFAASFVSGYGLSVEVTLLNEDGSKYQPTGTTGVASVNGHEITWTPTVAGAGEFPGMKLKAKVVVKSPYNEYTGEVTITVE